MKKLLFIIFILLIPLSAGADYSIYLKNGAVISGVKSYDESGSDVIVYFGTGSMILSHEDIMKISGTEPLEKEPEKTESTTERRDVQQRQERNERPARELPQPQSQDQSDDKREQINALMKDRDSVMSEIRDAEAKENKLVLEINEKTGKRFSYNTIQIKQLEKEVAPLQEDLRNVQQSKATLVQKLSSIEAELKNMEGKGQREE